MDVHITPDEMNDQRTLAAQARDNACRIWRDSIVDYGIRAIMATSDEDAISGNWPDSVKDIIVDGVRFVLCLQIK